MPPIAQRLREPAAFVLLAFGAISTLFHTITFLFGPGEDGLSFSNRALLGVTLLLSVEVTAALLGAVWLAHVTGQLKTAKVITLIALIAIAAEDLFGVVALFSSFGADEAPTPDANGAAFGSGWGKTQSFFVSLAQLAVAGIASWLILNYFQQHNPRPVQGYGQPPQQQGQWGQQPAPQGQWGPPPQQQAPAPAPQGQWGPPPQQQAAPPPQPQWGQPQPPQQDADSMMTQAIPTVPQAGQPQQQQQQQPPQQGEGGLPIGNWTAE
ncbi:MAG: hypothetical protein HOV87_27025 [Catenulispora sp.]|nr:hypothetical protein [Catenulispora sp.]